jgi:hypothetical protein
VFNSFHNHNGQKAFEPLEMTLPQQAANLLEQTLK